ncbi:MAG: hypothetical protein D6798_10690 [Deltaproteobacteria bacterium]|nr:MAG: hypothetical protein D6798_10690 [Deltaproteobacteria bacterium]
MVNALGWSSDVFLPTEPGRLCRGRERWIESYQVEDPPQLHRVVVSGAEFSDDSARDARRGLRYSGLGLATVLDAVRNGATVVAWCEQGHPRLVPDDAIAIEEYDLRRPGGPLHRWAVRWSLLCPDADAIQRAIDGGADVFTVHGDDTPAFEGDALREPLRDAVFLLTGSRVEGHPLRLFQPVALIELLELSDMVVLLHEDKHARCLGIYTRTDPQLEPVLRGLVAGTSTLPVPFAIPPMLARWDRALWELRQEWDEEALGEFPVPPAPEGGWGWGRRRRTRQPAAADEE